MPYSPTEVSGMEIIKETSKNLRKVHDSFPGDNPNHHIKEVEVPVTVDKTTFKTIEEFFCTFDTSKYKNEGYALICDENGKDYPRRRFWLDKSKTAESIMNMLCAVDSIDMTSITLFLTEKENENSVLIVLFSH